MNLGRLKDELSLYIRDSVLQSYFTNWINDALLALAGDFHFPALERHTPWVLPTNVNGWIFTLPETFHRKITRCMNSGIADVHISQRKGEIIDQDPDHDETGDYVTHVFADETGGDKLLLTYPKADDLLYLWGLEKPEVLVEDSQEPTWFPPEYRHQVIIPLVILRNYPILQDLVENAPHQSLQFWQKEHAKGLYGWPGGGIGLVNYLARSLGGPRRHGGRDPLP